jgi:transposase
MPGKRKSHTAAFKAQVALAALKNDRTVSQLASHFGIHATLVHSWKKLLLQGVEQLFASGSTASSRDSEAHEAQLYEQIGRLKMELEWLKKKVASGG